MTTNMPKRNAKPVGTFDLDAYLAALPVDAREALNTLRKAISAAAPRAVEGTSYGLPAFRLDGHPLVCFAMTSGHCSFYPMSPAVIRAHAIELKDFETSKGTIRFQPERPLPAALVRKLVKARIAEIEAGQMPKTTSQPKPRSRTTAKSKPRA